MDRLFDCEVRYYHKDHDFHSTTFYLFLNLFQLNILNLVIDIEVE